MGELIWLIIVVSIIVNVVKKQNRPDDKYNAKRSNQQSAQSKYKQQVQQELKERLQQRYEKVQMQQKQYQPTQKKQYQPTQKKQYQPTQKKQYQPAQKNSYQPTREPEDDILSRATANVMENQYDKLENEMEMSGKSSAMQTGAKELANTTVIEDTSALMQSVDDLIVMGYQPSLTFERDFLAEGIDMLNQFEVPDTIQNI